MPIPVIHNHDGHVDDLLSCLVLWLANEIDLQVVAVTNGDCYADQIYEAMLKIATFLDLEGTEIAYSKDDMPHPFPENWRKESYIINELPLFSDHDFKKPYQQGRGRRSEVVLADCLQHSRTPVTVVCTCPLTVVAQVLKEHAELKNKVQELIVMAGAFNVPGNVAENGHDGTAEWNVYADPQAFKMVLDTGIPIKMIPLDVTNNMPITKEFIEKLDEQSETSRASQLAAKLLSLVKGFEYYFWDTVTTGAVIKPEIYTFKEMRIDVQTQGKSTGRTATALFGGKKVQVATDIHKDQFAEMLLKILRSR